MIERIEDNSIIIDYGNGTVVMLPANGVREDKVKTLTVDERLANTEEENVQLNLQIIELWEVLISGGVI